jgi:pSer/pThr/pTyr-binding forkhead associated (FHA) protein
VSRNHATITYDSQTAQFILEDNSSKFGTLVLQKKFRIDESSPAMFQVGPNLFSVKMVKGLD